MSCCSAASCYERAEIPPDQEAALAARFRRVPTGVALGLEDVAKTILFLSCDDSSGITGTVLVIDAGDLTAAERDTNERTAFMDRAGAPFSGDGLAHRHT